MNNERKKISYDVGIRIRELRKERYMSQEVLAFNSDINPAYLGKIERGEKCPTIDTIYKICVGLKIPISELLDIERGTNPTSEEAMYRIKNALSGVDAESAVKIAEIVERISDIYKNEQAAKNKN